MLPTLQESERISLHKAGMESESHKPCQDPSGRVFPSSPSSACHSALHCWSCQGWFLLSGCIRRTSRWHSLIRCWRPCLPEYSWVTCHDRWRQGCRTSGSPQRWALKQSGGKKTQNIRPAEGQKEHGQDDTVDLQQLRNAEVIFEPGHEMHAAARSFRRVNILWHESLIHQEDKVGQYLSWLLWHWVFFPSARVSFLRLLVEEDGMIRSKVFSAKDSTKQNGRALIWTSNSLSPVLWPSASKDQATGISSS